MKQSLVALMMVLVCGLAAAQETVYTDASAFPLYGKAVEQTSGLYQRLPSELEGVSRKPVWDLGLNSSGLYIRFRSDAPEIWARWTNRNYHMPHMTDVGVGGLDLYARIGGQWRFVGAGFTWASGKEHERKLVANMSSEMREYMLYLPLYDCLDALEIGVPEGSVLQAPALASPASDRPVVAYGTSILQGGCASRPGMAHTNILSRKIDREVINLGFSGNALLDLEIAGLIAKVENPSLVILDYVPNSSPEQIEARGEEFFRIIRAAHPGVPVIFVEDPTFSIAVVDREMKKEIEDKNAAQKALFAKLRKAGEKKIYYVPSEGMTASDGEDFVDGIHLTDLGMVHYVDHILPTVRKALKK